MDNQNDVVDDSVLEYISIDTLNKEKRNFFVPNYQRGYRWTKTDVDALLDDVLEFRTLQIYKSQEDSTYCLQPIVVRKIDTQVLGSLGLDSDLQWYEVIDGQQRLTTIYLVSLYLNKFVLGPTLKTTLPDIRYQTRPESGKFLEDLSSDVGNPDVARQNVDFSHMRNAYSAIHDWFEGKANGIDKQYLREFSDAFLFRTKVIWYETKEPDVIEVFSRLNMYKIRLTNAELVKALLLNRKNFGGNASSSERVRLRQLEISQEWDRIESRLHEKRLWSFLVDPKAESFETRIDLVLHLVSNVTGRGDYLESFHYFRKMLDKENITKTNTAIEDVWASIKTAFQTLEGWYEDKTIYHRIGFLICSNATLSGLYQKFTGTEKTAMSRSGFIAYLDKKIKEYFNNVDIDDAGYDNKETFNILLLHNIITMDRDADELVRFPFEQFKAIQWDIEHVHATADGVPLDQAPFKSWLDETLPYINLIPDQSDLVEEMERLKEANVADAEKKSVYDRVRALFSDNGAENDDIGNLVLLDRGTNRSYKASVFPKKRGDIIRLIKVKGFVPICTRNVFLKFYREDAGDVFFWGQKDRKAYLDDIKTLLSRYLKIDVKKGADNE